MAIAPVTVTFSLFDFLGYVPDVRRTKVILLTNVDSGFLVDTTTGGGFRLTDARVAIDAAGLATFDVLPSGATGLNPAEYQIKVIIDAANPATNQRERVDLGWYTITEAANLKDLADEQAIPPTYLSTVTAQLDAKVADAEAERVAAEVARVGAEAAEASAQALVLSDLGTTDGQTRALIENPASQTAGALSATVESIAVRGLNLEKASGVDPTGTTECGAAIQAAITAAEAAGVPTVAAAGTFYKIATGLTIKKDCDLSRAVIAYTGSGVALTVGDAAGAVVRRKGIRLPYLINEAKTGPGWGAVAGSVGVRLHNVNESHVYLSDVHNFESGLQLYSDSAPGVAYNEIYLSRLSNNKRNAHFTSDVDGWTNQNNLHGGALSHLAEEGSLVAGVRQVLMEGTSPWVPDGNTFNGTSLENLGVAEYLIDSNGWYNQFIGCRYEWTGTPGDQAVIWRAGAKGNRLIGGWGVEDLTVTREAGSLSNDIDSPLVNQSLWLPASAMVTASGAPTAMQYAGTPYWRLADATADEVAGTVTIPDGWTAVDVTVVWFTESASGNVVLYSKTQGYAAGADVGFGGFAGSGAVSADGGAHKAVHSIVGADVAVTPGPRLISVLRDGTGGADTLGGSIGLLGVRIDRAA